MGEIQATGCPGGLLGIPLMANRSAPDINIHVHSHVYIHIYSNIYLASSWSTREGGDPFGCITPPHPNVYTAWISPNTKDLHNYETNYKSRDRALQFDRTCGFFVFVPSASLSYTCPTHNIKLTLLITLFASNGHLTKKTASILQREDIPAVFFISLVKSWN